MAAPKEAEIFGQKATLFQDGDHPVYLLPDGRFAVKYDGLWKGHRTLKSALKQVEVERPSMQIMQVPYTSSDHDVPEVTSCEVVEWKGKRIITKKGTRVHARSWATWYVFNQEIADRINDLEKRKQKADLAFEKEYDAIMKKAVRVGEGNFKKLLKEQQTPAE